MRRIDGDQAASGGTCTRSPRSAYCSDETGPDRQARLRSPLRHKPPPSMPHLTERPHPDPNRVVEHGFDAMRVLDAPARGRPRARHRRALARIDGAGLGRLVPAPGRGARRAARAGAAAVAGRHRRRGHRRRAGLAGRRRRARPCQRPALSPSGLAGVAVSRMGAGLPARPAVVAQCHPRRAGHRAAPRGRDRLRGAPVARRLRAVEPAVDQPRGGPAARSSRAGSTSGRGLPTRAGRVERGDRPAAGRHRGLPSSATTSRRRPARW